MKDSSKLLGFDLNRKLLFSEFRRVDFPSRRKLYFNLDRKLAFDSQRKLPFGRKGIDFRHFVCGRCGTTVDGEAKRCPGCKAVFRKTEEQISSDTKVRPSRDIKHSKMNKLFGDEYTEKKKPPPDRRQLGYRCSSCGNNLRYISSHRKWYCDRCRIYIGTSQRGSPRKIRRYSPPARAGGSGTKFVEEREKRKRYPSELVIVEDLNKKKRKVR
jgi:predicted amidophosphoribosyltransferase